MLATMLTPATTPNKCARQHPKQQGPLTCTSTRLVQMQVWPLLRWLLPTTSRTALSRSAGRQARWGRQAGRSTTAQQEGGLGHALSCVMNTGPATLESKTLATRPTTQALTRILKDDEGSVASQLQRHTLHRGSRPLGQQLAHRRAAREPKLAHLHQQAAGGREQGRRFPGSKAPAAGRGCPG